MANNTWTSSPIIGVGFDLKETSPSHTLGTTVPLNYSQAGGVRIGHFAMYVQASGIIANSAYCTVDTSSISCLATSVAVSTSNGFFRNGSVAFAANDYGWVFCTNIAVPQGDKPPNLPNP